MMNERLWNQMDNLKNYFATLTRRVVPELVISNGIENKDFLEKFPLSNVESVLAFEKALEADNNVENKLVCLYR